MIQYASNITYRKQDSLKQTLKRNAGVAENYNTSINEVKLQSSAVT